MKTEALIQDLAHRGTPVSPIPAPRTQFLRWMLLSVGLVALGVFVLGSRPDLISAFRRPVFVWQALLLGALTASSAGSALVLSIPGRHGPWTTRIPTLTLLAWFILISMTLLLNGGLSAGVGIRCVRNIVALGFLPCLTLFWMARRAAPMAYALVGLLSALSASALACLGTRFVCQNEGMVHILVWHCLPVVGLGLAGAALGRTCLDFKPRSRGDGVTGIRD